MIKTENKNENNDNTQTLLFIITIAIVSIAVGISFGYSCGKLLTKEKRLLAKQRIQQAEQELKEAAKEKKELHELIAKSENKGNKVTSGHSYTRKNEYTKERYYRDSKGELISEREAENMIWKTRNNIEKMPDGLKEAYYEGMLQAVEKEWDRVKRQGPVVR